jgi:ABC-type multidrug transport system ATPase subunit
VLEFDELHKSYGDHRVLEGVGFTVAPGSMFGFCGSNGAGKTTTMRIAMGLARADAGEVRWQGGRWTRGPAAASATCRRSAGSTRRCGSASS